MSGPKGKARRCILGLPPQTTGAITFALSLFLFSYLFSTPPQAGPLLIHAFLSCFVNNFTHHLSSQYGRGPAADSGVSADYSGCSAVPEDSRCDSRIPSLQGRTANGPSIPPHAAAHCLDLVLQKLQVGVRGELYHLPRLR